jgi:lycopene cyclase domain-containing protein
LVVVAMPERWYYLAVLFACLVVTLPLEFMIGARVYRDPRRTLKTIAPVYVLFAAWDLAATVRGHWWFSHRYTLGPRWLALPLEEWLFFAVVPLCALLTYEAVTIMTGRRSDA